MTDQQTNAVAQRRGDIQGLRAVAVGLVVAYHAGLPVPGGYLGVDLFFVISGYVIAQLLLRELETTRSIALTRFYLRRAKRLTPALGLLVGFVMLVSAILLSPMGMQQNAAKTGLAALALSANWVIATTSGGYFDLPATQNPLLHTWSLAVEEQFYIWFPFALLALWRIGGRRLAAVVMAALGLLSLALTLWVHQNALDGPLAWAFGFYGPAARLFQFAAGVLMILVTRARQPNAGIQRVAPMLGWALLLAALLVSSQMDAGAISGRVLMTAAGALLLLPRGHQSPDGRLLNSPVMRHIGDASYSIYLWHWPFIVIATYIWPLQTWVAGVAAIASLPVAWVTFRGVENPIRNLTAPTNRMWFGLAACFLALPMVLAAGLGYVAKTIWFPRYESGAISGALSGDIGAKTFDDFVGGNTRPCRVAASVNNDAIGPACLDAGAFGDPRVVIIGDSHSGHLLPGLASAAPNIPFRYFYTTSLHYPNVDERARLLRALQSTSSAQVVVLNAFWVHARGFGPDLRQFIIHLRGLGVQVLVMDDVPDFPFDSFACKYGLSPFLASSRCEQPLASFEDRYQAYERELSLATAGIPGSQLVRTANLFCSGASCSMSDGKHVLYLDANHLNVMGSIRVATAIVPAIQHALAAVSAAGSRGTTDM